jgi:hypothetical protein
LGLPLPKHPIVGFTEVVAKERVKLLLVVSANSLDSVERIRQTPSGESASRDFADMDGLMIGVASGVLSLPMIGLPAAQGIEGEPETRTKRLLGYPMDNYGSVSLLTKPR